MLVKTVNSCTDSSDIEHTQGAGATQLFFSLTPLFSQNLLAGARLGFTPQTLFEGPAQRDLFHMDRPATRAGQLETQV